MAVASRHLPPSFPNLNETFGGGGGGAGGWEGRGEVVDTVSTLAVLIHHLSID